MKKAAPSVKDEKELPSRGTWQKYSRPGIQNMQTLRECFAKCNMTDRDGSNFNTHVFIFTNAFYLFEGFMFPI